MAKPLSLLPIKPNYLSLLKKAGYDTVGDLNGSTMETLSSELKISEEDASQILQALQSNAPTAGAPKNSSYFPVSQSASSLLTNTLIHKCGISAVDQLLEGGLRKTQCLEIAGPPGSGKEILALEFIRSALDENSEVLVIDCQNAMHPSFLREKLGEEMCDMLNHVSVNGYSELFAFLNQLPKYLADNPAISLIVFASLSIPFQLCPNHSTKLRLLTLLKTTLVHLGSRSNLAFIATMQLSTKLQNQDGTSANFDTGAKAVMVPALGDTWYLLQKTFRILLYRDPAGRSYLALTGSPSPSKDGLVAPLNFSIEKARIIISSQ